MTTEQKNREYKVLLYSHEEDNTHNILAGRIAIYKMTTTTCTPELVCTTKLTQKYSDKTEIIERPIFKLREIPDVMRKQGWPKAGQIQDAWFNGKYLVFTDDQRSGKVALPPEAIRHDLISWHWLEQFERVVQAREALITRLIFSPAAKGALIGQLARLNNAGFFKDKEGLITLNYTPENLLEYHSKFQFQLAKIDDGVLEKPQTRKQVDELFAALGSFTLYAAIQQMTVTNNEKGKKRIRIDKIVIYVKDTYDFHGKQYLGHWNRDDMRLPYFPSKWNGFWKEEAERWDLLLVDKVSDLEAGKAFLPVNNSDYQAWALKHKQGGDMIIFSDTKTYPVLQEKLEYEL